MEEKSRTTPYPLRMPEDLRAGLEAAAEKNGRSLNAEVVSRLQRSFNDATVSEETYNFLARMLATIQRHTSRLLETLPPELTKENENVAVIKGIYSLFEGEPGEKTVDMLRHLAPYLGLQSELPPEEQDERWDATKALVRRRGIVGAADEIRRQETAQLQQAASVNDERALSEPQKIQSEQRAEKGTPVQRKRVTSEALKRIEQALDDNSEEIDLSSVKRVTRTKRPT